MPFNDECEHSAKRIANQPALQGVQGPDWQSSCPSVLTRLIKGREVRLDTIERKVNTMKNTPIDTIRASRIKAVIWANDSENGTFYSVNFARTYRDGEVLKDADSFSGSELLVVAHLAQQAFDRITALNAQNKAQNTAQQAA